MYDLWLSLLLLFAAAMVAALAARRKRDRCLKYFDGEPVLILLASRKWVWGRFTAYPKVMELAFEHRLPDRFDIIFPRSKALVRHCLD